MAASKPQPYYPPGFVPPKEKPLAKEATTEPKLAAEKPAEQVVPSFDALKADMQKLATAMENGHAFPQATSVFSPESAKQAEKASIEAAAAKVPQPAMAKAEATAERVKPEPYYPPGFVPPKSKTETAVASGATTAGAPPTGATSPSPTPAAPAKAESLQVAAKTEKAHAAPKSERGTPAATPRSPYGEALHAEAKEHVRANNVIAAGLAQGLSVDALKALVEHRLPEHAKDLALKTMDGASDSIALAANLAESKKVASALQSAAMKAATPEQAQAMVEARLNGEAAKSAVGAIVAVADMQASKLAASEPVKPSAPTAEQPQVAATPAAVPEVAPQADATKATPQAESHKEASGVTVASISATNEDIERRPLSDAPVNASAPDLAQGAAPVAAQATEANVKETISHEPSAPTTPVEVSATLADASPKAPIEERSFVAEAVQKAPIEDKSTFAAATHKAPIEERSMVAEASQKAPIEERSIVAEAVQKAPIEDKSIVASAQPLEAPTAAPENDSSSFASMLGKGLSFAFPMAAAVVNMATGEKPDTALAKAYDDSYLSVAGNAISGMVAKVSSAFQDAPATGEVLAKEGAAAADNVQTALTETIQTAAAAGAKVSLEDALVSHMSNKGFDSESVAAAVQIAQAIREGNDSQNIVDAVLVLHKDAGLGEPIATVTTAQDAMSIAKVADSILALDTLERIANNGMDTRHVEELRGAIPEAVAGKTDLELSQITGPAKTSISDLENIGSRQEQQKEEPQIVSQADMSGGMSM